LEAVGQNSFGKRFNAAFPIILIGPIPASIFGFLVNCFANDNLPLTIALSISLDLVVGSEIILLYFYGKRRILSSNFDPQGKDLLVDSFFPKRKSNLRKNGVS
jgi:hypothetical protein